MIQNISHTRGILRDSKELIETAKERLQGVEYDTMIGTGLSGSLVIPVLARALGKHFAIIRKEPSAHTSAQFEGEIGDRWIFVDDFIATGLTMSIVLRTVKEISLQHGERPKFAGAYLYDTTSVGEYDNETHQFEYVAGEYREPGSFNYGPYRL